MKDRAISYALLSAVLFGASTPAAKALLAEVDQRVLAGLLFVADGLGVAIARRALEWTSVIHRTREATLVGKEWFWLGAATLAGGVGPLLLMAGLVPHRSGDSVVAADARRRVHRRDRMVRVPRTLRPTDRARHVLHRRRLVVLGMVRCTHHVRPVRTARHSGGLPRLGGGQ